LLVWGLNDREYINYLNLFIQPLLFQKAC